ncbi:hypothetical protein [Azospirillum doebereinerae]
MLPYYAVKCRRCATGASPTRALMWAVPWLLGRTATARRTQS